MTSLTGWIKFHRKTMESSVWNLSDAQFKVWVTCLLLANNKDRKWWDGHDEVIIPRGSFVTSEPKLAKEAKVTTMESAAAGLIQERGASRIITVPYLFFPGMILKRNVLGEMDRLQKTYRDLPMAVTPPLGIDDRVIKVAAQRVREVWKQVAISEA